MKTLLVNIGILGVLVSGVLVCIGFRRKPFGHFSWREMFIRDIATQQKCGAQLVGEGLWLMSWSALMGIYVYWKI